MGRLWWLLPGNAAHSDANLFFGRFETFTVATY